MLDELSSLLTTRRFGRTAEAYVSIGSTNRRALDWAEAGAPEGALVVAEHQTAGRGRHGRSWTDAPGHNLLFSLVLRPPLPADRLGLLSLAAALAVAETVAPWVGPVRPTLKWPNDVLLEGRKTCGLLVEARLGTTPVAVLGVGLNVNQTAFPPELAERATSLALVAGRPLLRVGLLAALLAHLEARYDELLADGGEAARRDFEERMARADGPVTLHANGRTVTGHLEGLAPDGGLRLRTPDGLRTFHAGEVSFTPPDP